MRTEDALDEFERASRDARPVDGEARVQPLESFIAATTVALAEMAGTEVAVQGVYRATLDRPSGDITVALRLRMATEGMLVLNFPARTAAALAGRVLAEVQEAMNESLIRDCVGEIANVIAGQAKTLLAGTPHQMTFSLPQVVVGGRPEFGTEPGYGCTVVAFRSDAGDFTMRLATEGSCAF
jgi:chemotaxis protein CheX